MEKVTYLIRFHPKILQHAYLCRNRIIVKSFVTIWAFFFLVMGVAGMESRCNPSFYPAPDSVPPPPPGSNALLTGPEQGCTGETASFSADVPVACECQWMVNGVLQAVTTSPLLVTWSQAGLNIIILSFLCSGGQTSPPTSLGVQVYEAPSVDLGPDTTIIQGEEILLDAGNPGSAYLWSTGATSQSILVSMAGTYSVTVSNPCGTDWDEVEVFVFIGLDEPERIFDGRVYTRGQELRLEAGSREIRSLMVTGAMGMTIYRGPFVSSLALPEKGLYIVRMQAGTKYFYKKVVAD